MRKSTLFATVALSLAAAFAANVAQAREADVQWSVTIGSPGRHDRGIGPGWRER